MPGPVGGFNDDFSPGAFWTGMIDLYRIDGDHIVEHWDVIEEITSESTWVNSGKF